MDFTIPESLKYTPSHEWIKIEGEEGIVGITDFAQDQLGDIVYVELPELNATFDKGDELAEIESVKAIGEIFMPLTGEVIEINEEINDSPESVNNSPYEDGWLIKIRISKSEEVNDLLDAETYSKKIEEEML